MTICNACGKDVQYIDTRKQGIVCCEAEPVKGIQRSGRIVEVYLEHKCNGRPCEEVSEKEDEPAPLWVGGSFSE